MRYVERLVIYDPMMYAHDTIDMIVTTDLPWMTIRFGNITNIRLAAVRITRGEVIRLFNGRNR